MTRGFSPHIPVASPRPRITGANAAVFTPARKPSGVVSCCAQIEAPFGKLQVCDTMRAHCGVFFHIEAGQIIEQHDFDCLEPF